MTHTYTDSSMPPVSQWLNKIGHYDITRPVSASSSGAAAPAVLNTSAASTVAHNLLTTPQAQEALYKGCAAQESTKAREAFIKFLHQHMANKSPQVSLTPPKNLEDIYGAMGAKLFKAAIKEEAQSRAFRDAVFLQSVKHYPGPKWRKRLLLWVGGPSASGKSFGTNALIKDLARFPGLEPQVGTSAGNYVVSIDGGVEREVSQMRQMALQVALQQGYQGIQDLHSYVNLGIKKHVKNAVTMQDNLHMVIPDTFTTGTDTDTMKACAKDPNMVQMFAQVKHQSGYMQRFQTAVKSMGNSRAWYKKSDKIGQIDKVQMNNRDIGCESKEYQGQYFKFGVIFTKWAKSKLKHIDKNAYMIQLTNDLICVRKNAHGKWEECAPNEESTVMLSSRDLARWNRFKETGKMHSATLSRTKKAIVSNLEMQAQTIDLPEWIKFCKKHNLLSPALVSKPLKRSEKYTVGRTQSEASALDQEPRASVSSMSRAGSDPTSTRRSQRRHAAASRSHADDLSSIGVVFDVKPPSLSAAPGVAPTVSVSATTAPAATKRPVVSPISNKAKAQDMQTQMAHKLDNAIQRSIMERRQGSTARTSDWQVTQNNGKIQLHKKSGTNLAGIAKVEKSFSLSPVINTPGYTIQAHNAAAQKNVGKMAQALSDEYENKSMITINPGDDVIDALTAYARGGLDLNRVGVRVSPDLRVSVKAYIQQYAGLSAPQANAALAEMDQAVQTFHRKLEA